MPPIKRTKFKLAPEQLLEMFYWLKLMRGFDLIPVVIGLFGIGEVLMTAQ